jgi:hypothetical protein
LFAQHGHANKTPTDDVRRSGRANKGHHTKNADALDETMLSTNPKPKGKGKSDKNPPAAGSTVGSARSQSAENEEGDEEALIRCVCGDQRDIRGRKMICCDKCEAWQHNRCLNLPEGDDYWDNKSYYCEQCHPQDHVELLAAMARGEKPWNRKKGQKPPKSRPSDVHSVKGDDKQGKSKPPTPAQHSPAPTPAPLQTSTQASPAPALVPTPKEAPHSKADAKVSRLAPST